MMKTRLLLGALAIAGLLGSTFAADAKPNHHSKHPSSTTTGATMKQDGGTKPDSAAPANPSGGTPTGAGSGKTPGAGN
ncbi:hypothetical protein SAMN05444159_4287 [Bradyrhizobium lablabi]|uniref:Pentapeptide MXKDX repeat protein n=1 Tax=Bradyrhizobium lablabi TaxID=722472 RepID=A0A1M6VML9_9BRAD|nr:hypothetical protein [Bradyrhizobium lablabi]SHK82748.1 hypothetical protein SAMN05444159_4287 [Bradyrhizobium lablabi]